MSSWVQKDIILLTGDEMKIEVEKKYQTLFDTLTKTLYQNPNIRIEQLKKKLLSTHSVNEEVIDEIIYYLLSKDYLAIIEPNKKFERNKIKLIEKPEIESIGDREREEYPEILITLPPYNIFGLETELIQLDFPINTLKEEFQKLFEKANHSIYICSPFLEYNGFDTYLPTLLSKAKDGVDVKIIARQISNTDPDSRYEQIKRIQKIFKEKNTSISIRNYHFFNDRVVVSSTHAKMIVCDYEYGYIGSGELRKNSFDKNFEVGVILKGEQAYQLGKIFDKLFSVSTNIPIEEE